MNKPLLNRNLIVVSIRGCRAIPLHAMILASMILATCLFVLNPLPLLAAENIELEALLEMEPFDWSVVDPPSVIDQCTSALADKKILKKDKICLLYLLRGKALILVGKDESAIRDLTELLKIQSDDYRALRFRGETYASLNQYDKAQADFESLIKIRPKCATGYACLSRCLCERGHRDASKMYAEKAIALDSDDPEGFLAHAEVSLRSRNYLQGLKDLNRCIALSFGNGTTIAARPFLLRAATHMNIFDNPTKAFPDLLMALRLNPYDDRVKGLFCEYYFRLGKYNMAFHISEQLSKTREIRPDVLARRVDCLLQRSRNKEAREVAELIIRREPQWWGHYVSRGNLYFSENKYKEALQDYDKSLSLHQDNFAAMAAKAYLLAACPQSQFRDGSTARSLATECCERTGYQASRRLMLLAMACAECGDFNAAVRWAKKSLEKADPNFPFLANYRQRLALFENKKPYRFSHESRIFDYLCP